jgi:hypothetical protein
MMRSLESIYSYCTGLVEASGKRLKAGNMFAKVLSDNDDSGRHGVLVPTEVYSFFPAVDIQDPQQNATVYFSVIDVLSGESRALAYKYYQRYPERRITCLNASFNDRKHGRRVAVFLNAQHTDGTSCIYTDLLLEYVDGEFGTALGVLFGEVLPLKDGTFVLRAVDSPDFLPDEALSDLLERFDDISSRGYIDSLRPGDTGIGYTFETLMGIVENNDQRADFRGVEIKCKQVKDTAGRGGKINLFQKAPQWDQRLRGIERLRMIGALGENERYACHSQVSTTSNNLGLWLDLAASPEQVDIFKNESRFGYWPHAVLERRLQEKHSRAVFIKADTRTTGGQQRFHYKELVYCERPSILNFTNLISDRRIVFEFMMHENKPGGVRNHGYPWRLSSDDYLNDLFSFRIKLR